MLADVDDGWWEPVAAWWAKAARARAHIETIGAMVREYLHGGAYEVVAKAAGPGRTEFRVRLLKPVPSELLTTIGDALHNMRSCLDSIAFELACRHVGDMFTEKLQTRAQFPICSSRAAFDDFLSREGRPTMYGEREVAALLCAQPFAIHDELTAAGTELATTLDDEWRISELAWLNRLSNLDKHRRLPLLGWYVDLIYFRANIPGWQWTGSNSANLQDNDAIGSVTHPADSPDPGLWTTVELGLALADDPGYTDEVSGVLERWHAYITEWVLPRIFSVAAENRPPAVVARVRPGRAELPRPQNINQRLAKH
jgi:hypothetical protein